MDNPSASPDAEIELEILPVIRIYKDGRIQRLGDSGYVPPSPDDPSVPSRDVVIDPVTGVRARLYLPANPANTSKKKKLPILIYFHGGGFCAGSAFSPLCHRHLRCLAAAASLLVVSLDYRLAPEHPIPAAYLDSCAALRWVRDAADEWVSGHGDARCVFLSGDSAGANIAHHAAMRAGEEGAPVEGLLLVHPYFWGTERMESEKEEQSDNPSTMLSPSGIDPVWPFVCGGATTGNDDPRVNPLVEEAPPLEGLGCERVMVCVAGMDVLRDRGRAYFEALERGGKWGGEKLEFLESEGEDHVFHLIKPECPKAKEMIGRMVAFFKTGVQF